MLIKTPGKHHLTEHDVTDERLFHERRKFIRQGIVGAGLAAGASISPASWAVLNQFKTEIAKAERTTDLTELVNTWGEITGYNNFYELGTGKDDPKENADKLITDPWSIQVEGLCHKPGTYALEDILAKQTFEERIYRFRCVETWSMVVPWSGFELASLLHMFEPSSDARYVAFETLYDKSRPLPGQKRSVLRWPYREGLRMDEAMNPLSFMAVGIYGKPMPNQNGAPIRLVVPWKYGYKSIKSIVKIKFTSRQPDTSWNLSAPQEYGFYSNVNPTVKHPRWSQARERRIGEFLKRETLMFNGYEEEVAAMYSGMNLRKFH